MQIGDTEGLPSLLPYLNGRSAGIRLKFDFSDQEPASNTGAQVPCEPYSTLRRARIMLDGRSTIMSLIVLSQADNYRHNASELFPFTNEDIEKSWQQAWLKIRDSNTGTGPQNLPAVLPTQVGANGSIVPLRPLFYCCHRKQYSHSLCPLCGEDLELCREDELLKKADLPVYSGSLTRFLYCPSCHGIDPEAPFYQFPEVHESNKRVQNVQQLILGFSRLLVKDVLKEELTCVGCPQAQYCFGDEALAVQRMTVVQFYPFHMLLLDDADMNAADFCALLSGADLKDIKSRALLSGKVSLWPSFNNEEIDDFNEAGFLFCGDQRFFLEVLYLKLSFLGALWRLLNENPLAAVPNRTLEQVGVSYRRIQTRLPYLWHFSLNWIDPVGRPASGTMVSAVAQVMILEFFVRAWFYVLLVNPRQNMAKVLAALTEFQPSGDASKAPLLTAHASLAPENIFWAPQDAQLESDWTSLWETALRLGTQLFRSDTPFFNADSESPDFTDELETLIKQVHQALFQPAIRQPAGGEKKIDQTKHTNRSIAAILESVLEKWPTTAITENQQFPDGKAVNEAPASNLEPNADGDYQETIVLTNHEQGALVKGEKNVAQPLAVEKTTTLTPEDRSIVPGPSPADANMLEATVALQSGRPLRPLPAADLIEKKHAPTVSRDHIEKTAVMTKSLEPADMDDLEQTVVQRPHDGQIPHTSRPQMIKAYQSTRPDTDEADKDDLEATVVLKPKKRGGDRESKP